MYQVPTRDDFDRKLREQLHDATTTAGRERYVFMAQFAARGIPEGHYMNSGIANVLHKIHREILDGAMGLIHDFAYRMQFPAAEIAGWARPHLEELTDILLDKIPEADLPQMRSQFEQRLNSALRDIEIGFIGDRNMVIKDSDRRALVLQKFYNEREANRPIRLPFDPSASPEERENNARICQQLAESGLIEWHSSLGESEGYGRITSRGIDVIEGNAPAPIAINIDSRQFHNLSNVQIGQGNAQGITITGEKIVAAINNSNATTAEKEKAKSLFQSLLDNPLLAKVVGLFGSNASA